MFLLSTYVHISGVILETVLDHVRKRKVTRSLDDRKIFIFYIFDCRLLS